MEELIKGNLKLTETYTYVQLGGCMHHTFGVTKIKFIFAVVCVFRVVEKHTIKKTIDAMSTVWFLFTMH